MVDLSKANDYFSTRLFSDEWNTADDLIKTNAIITAENQILLKYSIPDNKKTTDEYFNAVCEQAIFLLQFDRERYQLQREGVTQYTVEDISVTMKTVASGIPISSFAEQMLKSITQTGKVGNIV
jgi:hypothetical protein